MSESSGGLCGQQSQGGGWSLRIRSSSLSPMCSWDTDQCSRKQSPVGRPEFKLWLAMLCPGPGAPSRPRFLFCAMGQLCGCSERVLGRSGCSRLGIHSFPSPHLH